MLAKVVGAALVGHVVSYDNGAPHSRMPPLGWSSWVGLGEKWPGPKAEHPTFDFCDEASVMTSIDAFKATGLFDAGYRHFHLDDCWADKERTASGELQPERDHFPNGMKKIIDYAHSQGLAFGLYTCAGTLTCVGGRPGSKGHFAQDANTFAAWGVDVVKMDWCNTKGMDPKETYTEMSQALNKTGRHIHFNMCEWGVDDPWTWGPDVAQSWRATGDHTGTWKSTKSLIEERLRIPAAQGGGAYAWNDMDMLESGNYVQAAHANGKQGTMTALEYKTEFSIWAILASPLVVTTPLLNCSATDQFKGNYTPGVCKPELTPLQKEILLNKDVIAINQDVTPAGSVVQDEAGRAIVIARHLTGGDVAVAFLNTGDSTVQGSVDFSALGWTAQTAAKAQDLWDTSGPVLTATGKLPETGGFDVLPHQTLVYRLQRSPSVSAVV